jgi:hypothetical protein
MSEMFPESKQPKVYRNGKTYLENVEKWFISTQKCIEISDRNAI